jgi:hypothetical protein
MDADTRRELDRIWTSLDVAAKGAVTLGELGVKVDSIMKWLERSDRNRRWAVAQTVTILAAAGADIAAHVFK